MSLLQSYLSDPNSCPLCGGAVEGGPVDVEYTTARQPVLCTECNAHWTDNYTLTGITDLQDGDERPVPMEGPTPAETLGRLFTLRLHEHLGELHGFPATDRLKMIDAENRRRNDDTCASHDYCDANVSMDQAFRLSTGHCLRTNSDEDRALWLQAWDWAKSEGFATIKDWIDRD
jgi:hypothetical protein